VDYSRSVFKEFCVGPVVKCCLPTSIAAAVPGITKSNGNHWVKAKIIKTAISKMSGAL